MNTQESKSSVHLKQGIQSIYGLVERHCYSMGEDEFWAMVETVTKLRVFLDTLPVATQEEIVSSDKYWSQVNDFMTDWSEGVSPGSGWCQYLLARLPLASDQAPIQATWDLCY